MKFEKLSKVGERHASLLVTPQHRRPIDGHASSILRRGSKATGLILNLDSVPSKTRWDGAEADIVRSYVRVFSTILVSGEGVRIQVTGRTGSLFTDMRDSLEVLSIHLDGVHV